eukprot:PhF_6_TR15642/c0_g1_i5/m.24292
MEEHRYHSNPVFFRGSILSQLSDALLVPLDTLATTTKLYCTYEKGAAIEISGTITLEGPTSTSITYEGQLSYFSAPGGYGGTSLEPVDLSITHDNRTTTIKMMRHEETCNGFGNNDITLFLYDPVLDICDVYEALNVEA